MVMLMLVGRMDSKDTTALWARRPWLGKGRSVEKQQWSSVWVVGAGGGLGPGPGVEVERRQSASTSLPAHTHTGRTSSPVIVKYINISLCCSLKKNPIKPIQYGDLKSNTDTSFICVTFQIAALYSNCQFHWLIMWEMIW